MGFIPERDGDGVAFNRIKITHSGWHFQLYGMEFETAKKDSEVNTDVDGTDLGHLSLKFYDSNDQELTAQIDITASCVKTVADWEPTWDYEIIGGTFRQISVPASDVIFNCVAVPDLTAEQGGSVPFANNVNLRFVGTEDHIRADGRSPKQLAYDAVYHTNKLRFIIRHTTGLQHKIQLQMEVYRA